MALIRAYWADILRIVASLRAGTVTASVIMRQLASHPRQNGIAAALRELGRMERTLFVLDWIEDPELRRSTGQELNKGETRNSLAGAVFIQPPRRDPRPHLREPAAPRIGPQSGGDRHHPVEHRYLGDGVLTLGSR